MTMITINIVEGPSFAMPSANQTIGFISVSGKDFDTRFGERFGRSKLRWKCRNLRDLRINSVFV